ncbi:MAG: hypothetical protein ABSF29_12660 [Tepidisphaeraceae bacterium]|jgi:hypothetical protein
MEICPDCKGKRSIALFNTVVPCTRCSAAEVAGLLRIDASSRDDFGLLDLSGISFLSVFTPHDSLHFIKEKSGSVNNSTFQIPAASIIPDTPPFMHIRPETKIKAVAQFLTHATRPLIVYNDIPDGWLETLRHLVIKDMPKLHFCATINVSKIKPGIALAVDGARDWVVAAKEFIIPPGH